MRSSLADVPVMWHRPSPPSLPPRSSPKLRLSAKFTSLAPHGPFQLDSWPQTVLKPKNRAALDSVMGALVALHCLCSACTVNQCHKCLLLHQNRTHSVIYDRVAAVSSEKVAVLLPRMRGRYIASYRSPSGRVSGHKWCDRRLNHPF